VDNPMEIIVTLRDDPSPRVIPFSDLYALRENISSMMLLWDTSSYFIDCVSKTFIINGGRKIAFNHVGEGMILYRRRTRSELSTTGEPPKRMVIYILGFEIKSSNFLAFIEVSEDGNAWKWETKL
jgi:hypothetical protein